MSRVTLVLAFASAIVVALPASAQAQVSPTRVLIPASTLPGVPTGVRQDLERRRCAVPQADSSETVLRPNNFVTGSFHEIGKGGEWAVLCSIQDTSRILIYRNGSDIEPDSLGKQPDAQFVQQIAPKHFVFSRLIKVAPVSRLVELQTYATPVRGIQAGLIEHDGIEDIFLEKGSVAHYFHKVRWLVFQGSD
jgi:hypothetical protein